MTLRLRPEEQGHCHAGRLRIASERLWGPATMASRRQDGGELSRTEGLRAASTVRGNREARRANPLLAAAGRGPGVLWIGEKKGLRNARPSSGRTGSPPAPLLEDLYTP